jgi:hypothetical protein
MGKRENEQCSQYRKQLVERRAKQADVLERGEDALSVYDKTIAHRSPAEALRTATWLLANQVHYLTERVRECDRIPKQATLFDVAKTSSVPSSRPNS